MKPISKPQLVQIQILLTKAGIKDKEDRAAVILDYTQGRTGSSRQMYAQEAMELIKKFKGEDPNVAKAEKMRKKIISLAHEMGWRHAGTTSIDMAHVNDWCTKFGYLHKKLNDYKYEELPKLITQFEGVYKSFINKI